MTSYAQVCVPLAINKTFDYSVPPNLQKLVPGMRVCVPFVNKKVTGIVISLSSSTQLSSVKDIISALDEAPLIEESLLNLLIWVSKYYVCPLGLVLKAAVPAPIRGMKFQGLPEESLEERAQKKPSQPQLTLTSEQANAVGILSKAYEEQRYSSFLLHGATGSGKTEVYFRIMDLCLKNDQSVLYLVPEISLTPQLEHRITMRYPGISAVIHSNLSMAERKREWARAYLGAARIVIGVRSAVFAPLKNIGVIIVDEEHESSFKQLEKPRYHARDVAVMRAKLANRLIILGSATPSLESYHNACLKKYSLIAMPNKVTRFKMPLIKTVDMRKEPAASFSTLLSDTLISEIKKALNRKKQALLFLNRRGFHTCLVCVDCGWIMQCLSCSMTLTYHKSEKSMLCHACGAKNGVPKSCPKCLSANIKLRGTGTEKIENILGKLFQRHRISRIDADSTKKTGAHRNLYAQLKERDIDIIIGTQMIAKGLDIPTITLAGVLLADSSMHIPDFRSSEQTYQLVSQVIGRAGRSELESCVVIQTLDPAHYAVKGAVEMGYSWFFDQEMKFREALRYPPVVHLINILVCGKNSERSFSETVDLWKTLKKYCADIRQPVQAPIHKIKGIYRWQITLRCKNVMQLSGVISGAIEKQIRYSSCVVDVDPFGLS